jgi:LacI family transcriptional regulator
VDIDNVRGTRLVMEHLLGLGHRRIAHLTSGMIRSDALQRRETFFAVMAESGLPVPPEYNQLGEPYVVDVYHDPDVIAVSLESETRFEFYGPARYLLTLPDRPTAIFARDDRVARDVLLAARDLLISVPDQLSVVSFDDIPEAARMDPPLTTVRQPLVEMGAAATRLLLAMLSGEDVEPKTHWFEPKLIVRKSTARVPKEIV